MIGASRQLRFDDVFDVLEHRDRHNDIHRRIRFDVQKELYPAVTAFRVMWAYIRHIYFCLVENGSSHQFTKESAGRPPLRGRQDNCCSLMNWRPIEIFTKIGALLISIDQT